MGSVLLLIVLAFVAERIIWYQRRRMAKREAHMTEDERLAAAKMRVEKVKRSDKVIWIVFGLLAFGVFVATQFVRNSA